MCPDVQVFENADDNIVAHYTKINIALEYVLYSRTIKFGKLRNTNDPWEEDDSGPTFTGWGGDADKTGRFGKQP